MKTKRKISGNPLKEFEQRYKQESSINEITQENFDSKLGIALNSYTRLYDARDSKKFLMKFHNDPELEDVEDVTYFGFKTLGFVAKFFIDTKLDLSFHPETEKWFYEKVQELKDAKAERKPKTEEALKERGQNIQKAIINRVRETMGEIDQYIDDNKYVKEIDKSFDIIEWMKSKELLAIHGRKMVTRLQEEQQEFRDIEHDEQLQEGYRLISKKQILHFIELYDYVIDEIEKFINLQSNKRKQIQKPKKVKIEKIVKNFHYLKESEEFHIASVNPAEIIGSQVCIIYNVKYRSLKYLIAKDKTGLQMKGSTLLNYDEDLSKQQSLRKPHDILNKIVKASRKEFFNLIQDLTTKPAPTQGRVNADCLVISIFK